MIRTLLAVLLALPLLGQAARAQTDENLNIWSPSFYGEGTYNGPIAVTRSFDYPYISFELHADTCNGDPGSLAVPVQLHLLAVSNGTSYDVVVREKTCGVTLCGAEDYLGNACSISPDWGTPGLAPLMQDIGDSQADWTLRIVVDPTSALEPHGLVVEGQGGELDEFENGDNRLDSDDPDFALGAPYGWQTMPLPFTGRVRIGGNDFTVAGGTLNVSSPTFGCYVGGTLTYDGPGWTAPPIANTSSCGNLGRVAAGYDLVVTSTNTGTFTLEGTLAGLATTLEGRFAPQGFQATKATLRLPRGQGVHEGDANGPRPRGRRTLEVAINPSYAPTPGEASFYLSGGYLWFTSEQSPVSVGGLYPQVWNDSIIFGNTPEVHWRFDQDYQRFDQRRVDKLGAVTNDVRFRGAQLASGSAVIADGGLSFDLELPAGQGRTAYPRGTLTWDTTTVSVRGGAVQDALNGAGAMTSFRMEQTGRCAECQASDAGPNLVHTITFTRPEEMLGDGRVVARAAAVDAKWGPVKVGGGRVFERRADAGREVIFSMPGTVFDTTGTNMDVASLLAAPITLSGGPMEIHPIGSQTAQRGNGFFPGLTIGPEIYRNDDGQPVQGAGVMLGDTSLAVAIGGPEKPFQTIGSSDGTKLVITPAGITGAFNFDAGPSLSSVYGYPFALTRFAFRTVDNRTDDVTWLDGEVQVLGKADFRVPFRSLVLQCSGHFGDGLVDFAALTPQRLRAWNARFDVSRMAFTPGAQQSACGGADRKLAAGGGMRVEAFAKSFDLTATWNPDGSTVGDAKLAGDAVGELDKPATGNHADGTPRRGFMAALSSAKLESRDCTDSAQPASDACGWFTFGAKLGAPFWNAIDARVRATNVRVDGQPGTFKAARSLVARADYNPAQWTTERHDELLTRAKTDLAAGLDVTNNWVFDVTLPARWGYDAADSAYPRFVADPLRLAETDLKVIKVKGAVPYITEHATEVSFGASADLSKLEAAQVALKVDLTNQEDVKKIDAFFTKIIPGLDRPVEKAVGLLQNPAGALLKATGAGFDNFLGGAIKAALESDVVVSATDGLASALAEVQRLPLTLANQVFDKVKEGIDDAVTGVLGSVLSGPDKLALDLYDGLPAAWFGAVDAYNNALTQAQTVSDQVWDADVVPTFNSARDAINAFLTILGDNAQAGIVGAIGKARQGIGLALDALDTAKGVVRTLGPQAKQYLETARDVLTTTINLLDVDNNPSTPLAILKCPNGNANAGANPLLGKLADLEKLVKDITGTLANKGLEKLGGLIGKPLGLDLTFLKTADFYFAEVAGALTKQILGEPNGKKGVIPKVKELICDPNPNAPVQRLKGITTEVKNLLVPIRAQVLALLEPVTCSVTPPGGSPTMARLSCTVLMIETSLSDLQGPSDPKLDVAGKVTLRGLGRQLDKVQGQVATLRERLALFKTIELPPDPPTDPFADDLKLPESLKTDGAQAIRDVLKTIGRVVLDAVDIGTGTLGPDEGWIIGQGPARKSFIALLPDAIRKPVNQFVGLVQAEVGKELSGALSQLPFPTGKQMRDTMYQLVMQSAFVEQVDKLFHEGMAFLLGELNKVSLELLQQVNELIKQAVAKFNEIANQLLAGATSTIKDALGFSAVGITGSAIIQADEIERLHLEATFAMNKTQSSGSGPSAENKSETGTDFKAYLDAISWKVNGKAKNCLDPEASGSAPLDVKIGAQNLPIKFGANDGMSIKKLELGFTLASQNGDITPLGVFGGIETAGKLSFKAFELSDIGFAAGVGKLESYVGAKARANFQGTVMQVAFLAGKMCNLDVLKSLDPLAASFLKAPEGGAFKGAYVRGSASFPFINFGCLLQAGASADVGAWVFGNDQDQWTVGGLVAGGIYGKAICIVSAKGKITLAGQYANNAFSFLGTGWVGGGIGFCEPEEWNTPEDVANDGMCGTATASLKATYTDGSFSVSDPEFSGLD